MPSRAFTASRRTLTRLRLAAQAIATPFEGTPGTVVRHMLAMQAQDFPGAKWSVGLRLRDCGDAEVEAALTEGTIVRSWPMRGTLHLVPAEDLGWMLSVTSERMIAMFATRRRELGLDERSIEHMREIAIERLSGGRQLSREDLLGSWREAGIETSGQRGYHALWLLANTGTLVFGAPRGTTQTFALLEEWVASPRRLERDEALGEFARRYFRSHGPASVRDFAWWASLTLGDARRGLAETSHDLARLEVDGVEYWLDPGVLNAAEPSGVRLLPGFDEYLLGYQDRSAPMLAEHAALVVPGKNGVFQPTIVDRGEVVGTWRRTLRARSVDVTLAPFGRVGAGSRASAEAEARRFGTFLGRETTVLAQPSNSVEPAQ